MQLDPLCFVSHKLLSPHVLLNKSSLNVTQLEALVNLQAAHCPQPVLESRCSTELESVMGMK